MPLSAAQSLWPRHPHCLHRAGSYLDASPRTCRLYTSLAKRRIAHRVLLTPASGCQRLCQLERGLRVVTGATTLTQLSESKQHTVLDNSTLTGKRRRAWRCKSAQHSEGPSACSSDRGSVGAAQLGSQRKPKDTSLSAHGDGLQGAGESRLGSEQAKEPTSRNHQSHSPLMHGLSVPLKPYSSTLRNTTVSGQSEQKLPITSDLDVEASAGRYGSEQPPEVGIIPDSRLHAADPTSNNAAASTSGRSAYSGGLGAGSLLYPPAQRSQIRESWKHLMRWSKVFRKNGERGQSALDKAEKVVVFGGGSFGTAMGVALARQKASLQVVLLLRDPYVCKDINHLHINTRYLKDYELPLNVRATTSMVEAIVGAQYAIHAVPVQHSRVFLESVKDILGADVPIISVSKGLESGTGRMMSELIPEIMGRKHPTAFLSGPSFAKEVMDLRPTGVVAASRDGQLAREMQELFASPYMRVNNTSDVIGVEICGALKNVLAIAAGIVEGLDLGNNAMAALVTQGCAEIRWLAEKMGAKPATVAGLSGLGDIMLTCYGSLSRNRSVGVRLGRGEALDTILASSKQVAEGVTTAGVVVLLASKFRVKLPVLTAVAHILDSNLSPKHAVAEIMNLPQIEER